MTKKMLLRRYVLLAQAEEPIPPRPTTFEELQTFTSQGTWNAPESAWYKITVIGAGGQGGSGGNFYVGDYYSACAAGGGGGGGGGGALASYFEYLKKGTRLQIPALTGNVTLRVLETTLVAECGLPGDTGGSGSKGTPGAGGQGGYGGTARGGNNANWSGNKGTAGSTSNYQFSRAKGGGGGAGPISSRIYGRGGYGGDSGIVIEFDKNGSSTSAPLSGARGVSGAVIIEKGVQTL